MAQHLDHVVDSITKSLEEKLAKGNKGGAPITKGVIKQHLWVFVRCLIENPSFSSQTKEKMTTPMKDFGSKCKLDDEFMTKLAKGGIKVRPLFRGYLVLTAMPPFQGLCTAFRQLQSQQAADQKGRQEGGSAARYVRFFCPLLHEAHQRSCSGIEKLDDANKAGTREGKDCTLIVTEGDSAKTLAVCGLSVVGRDYFGVFPLRGKLMNVRQAKVQDMIKNKELSNLVKILGLKVSVPPPKVVGPCPHKPFHSTAISTPAWMSCATAS